MSILITGGTGYIGSHIVYNLRDHGHELVVVDNLCRSRRDVIPGDVPFYQQDILDSAGLEQIIRTRGIRTVIHLAAFLDVAESVREPEKYFRNNVTGTQSLLTACQSGGIEKLIFSSTGATYRSSAMPVRETDPTAPASPYGHSKLQAEELVRTSGIPSVILRYFNVAGADPQRRTGQQGRSATHLIAAACQAASGDRACLEIFGTDYPTADGTCIRDYIHVSDLADAHRVVMTQNFADPCTILNCGYGTGFSVRQVIERCKAVTGVDFPVFDVARRPGDQIQSVADNMILTTHTAWRPRYNDLDTIIRTAWEWYGRERVRKAA